MTIEQFQARVHDLGLTAGTSVLLQFNPSWADCTATVVEIGGDYSWSMPMS